MRKQSNSVAGQLALFDEMVPCSIHRDGLVWRERLLPFGPDERITSQGSPRFALAASEAVVQLARRSGRHAPQAQSSPLKGDSANAAQVNESPEPLRIALAGPGVAAVRDAHVAAGARQATPSQARETSHD